MKRWFPSILKSLGVKLFLLIFMVMAIVFVLFTLFSLRRSSRDWMNSLEVNATRTGFILESALRYAMLENCKEDVQNTIEAIAKQEGIMTIRIYDKEGMVIFSTNTDELYQIVDMENEKCMICHEHNQPLQMVPKGQLARLFRRDNGILTLGQIHPIQNSPECYLSDCHYHTEDQQVLGVLDLIMPVDFIEKSQHQSELDTMFLAVVLTILGGALTALFINKFVRKPVRSLISGIRQISDGNLETRIQKQSSDELGQLAKAFNKMSQSLYSAQRENEKWESELEGKIFDKTEELRSAQQQMIHLEKMASMGKLAATVAHELNNPLAGVLVYAKLITREMNDMPADLNNREELLRYLGVIQDETKRCGEVVRNLLSFARGSGKERSHHLFYPLLEKSLQIVHHHFELGGIQVNPLKKTDDQIYCQPDQIKQALIALFVNAVEAMPQGGNLTIEVKKVNDMLCINISDTGIGIPSDQLPHIFDPFVSTKHDGKGVGLGLSVVYGIIHRHGGKISVTSEVGKGTTFTLLLRRNPPDDKPLLDEKLLTDNNEEIHE